MTRRRVVGMIAVFVLGGAVATFQPVRAAASSPYGFTPPVPPDQAKLNASHVGWVRQGLDWSSIETSPGVYNFGTLDQAVAQENAAGVQISVVIQDAPGFRKTQACNGVSLFPGPNEMGTFAAVLSARYNGNNGHGYAQSFEIGNEEWDNYWGGSWSATTPCRTADWYGPVLKAGYQAIKANSPNALVGMTGLWWESTSHIQGYMTWLYQNGYGAYMDFANFHYYTGGDPSITNGDIPSYAAEWQTIHNVMAAYNDGAKPIWCTEVGWAVNSNGQPGAVVTLAQQSQYLQYVLDNSRTSGVVQRVFIYTLMDNDDGMNLWPTTGPLPSYNMLEAYIAQYPTWGAPSVAPTPSPTPTPTASPTPTPAPTPSPSPTPSPVPASVQPATLTSNSEAVTYAAPGKPNRCRKGTVTATGSFTTSGTGGTVPYEWIRTDSTGSRTIAEAPMTIAAGDTSSHSVAADSWTPSSTGSEQLVFLSTGAPPLAAQAFTCR
jgi:hypothetical protein